MTAREIINKWCDHAHDRALWTHKRHFWVIRDIFEGIKVKDNLKKSAIEFLKRKCKDSEEKIILLKGLQNYEL
jgi:hypothetical protein